MKTEELQKILAQIETSLAKAKSNKITAKANRDNINHIKIFI